jgi:hypothetical protein
MCVNLSVGFFSDGISVFSTNKTDSHDITEILLKVVLKHHKPTSQPYFTGNAEWGDLDL